MKRKLGSLKGIKAKRKDDEKKNKSRPQQPTPPPSQLFGGKGTDPGIFFLYTAMVGGTDKLKEKKGRQVPTL